jgi:hypothetical protein
MEIWKSIPGYENYEMTADGRVRSLNYNRTNKVKEMKPKLNSGYFRLTLSKNKKQRGLYVHVLLAITFLGHVPDGHKFVIDHINNNPLDNRLENLQIITSRENSTKDQKGNLPIGVSIARKKFRARIDIKGKLKCLGAFPTPEEASAAYQKALLNLDQPSA